MVSPKPISFVTRVYAIAFFSLSFTSLTATTKLHQQLGTCCGRQSADGVDASWGFERRASFHQVVGIKFARGIGKVKERDVCNKCNYIRSRPDSTAPFFSLSNPSSNRSVTPIYKQAFIILVRSQARVIPMINRPWGVAARQRSFIQYSTVAPEKYLWCDCPKRRRRRRRRLLLVGSLILVARYACHSSRGAQKRIHKWNILVVRGGTSVLASRLNFDSRLPRRRTIQRLVGRNLRITSHKTGVVTWNCVFTMLHKITIVPWCRGLSESPISIISHHNLPHLTLI